MLDELFGNFYYNNILYIIMVVLISFGIISDKRKKERITLSQRIDKHIDGIFLLKILSLSFAIRIFIEQIVLLLQIDFTKVASMDSLLKVVVQLIATCLFAPVFEEIIFRFGLFDYLKTKISVVMSIIITSIIFSFIHYYGVDGFMIVFILSIFCTYSYVNTNNLIYPITIHFFHNIYALISYIEIDNIYYIVLGLFNLLVYVLLKIKSSNKSVATK